MTGEEMRVKYCPNCGAVMNDNEYYCSHCGSGGGYGSDGGYSSDGGYGSGGYGQSGSYSPYGGYPSSAAPRSGDSTMSTFIKVFLIIGCIIEGWTLAALAWCIPMTISIFHSLRDRRPVSLAMKICTLLFVSRIAGILLLCMSENELYGGL